MRGRRGQGRVQGGRRDMGRLLEPSEPLDGGWRPRRHAGAETLNRFGDASPVNLMARQGDEARGIPATRAGAVAISWKRPVSQDNGITSCSLQRTGTRLDEQRGSVHFPAEQAKQHREDRLSRPRRRGPKQVRLHLNAAIFPAPFEHTQANIINTMNAQNLSGSGSNGGYRGSVDLSGRCKPECRHWRNRLGAVALRQIFGKACYAQRHG